MTRHIAINGRFLGRPISGVERYGREMLAAWDAMIPFLPGHPPIRILAPKGVEPGLALANMRFETLGRLRGHAWEQVELLAESRHDILVGLANSGPALHPRHLVVIHDAAVFRFPENYGFRYRVLHQTLCRLFAKRARLATVSEFSRTEIEHYLGVDGSRVAVCPNGADHLGKVAPDTAIVDRLALGNERVILAVGSASRNKNLGLILDAWRKMPSGNGRLVVVGPVNERIFAHNGGLADVQGVLYPGRVSDAELAALYRRADAFVFPSRYEGFGIPPLEAMANGCRVFASDIPPLLEVCGDAARYFGVDDANALADLMAGALNDSSPPPLSAMAERLERYRWEKSATALAGIAQDMARK